MYHTRNMFKIKKKVRKKTFTLLDGFAKINALIEEGRKVF